MQKILFSLIVLILVSCSAQKKATSTTIDDDGNLVGIATKDNFLVAPFNDWFTFNYEDYITNKKTINSLEPLLKKVTIKAFMGTWCSDSQEQTPIFYKILDETNFNYKNLELITLNTNKKTPNNLQKGFNIERVPTFIFYKNGKEIGRFVEYPRESVEADLLKIVSGEPYKHSYQDD